MRATLGGYDQAAYPVAATVHALYSYRPERLFGVPLVNILGWLLTGWLAMQLFALAEPHLTVRLSLNGKAIGWAPCSSGW
jgi:uncharacterized membrane protein